MPLALYINIMQAGPKPENSGLLYLRKLHIKNASVYNLSSMNTGNLNPANYIPKSTVLTRPK